MKSVLMFALALMMSAPAFALQAKAPLCADEAARFAKGAFVANVKPDFMVYVLQPDLVAMNHAVGGFETWSVRFNIDGVDYNPYVVTVSIPNCDLVKLTAPATQK